VALNRATILSNTSSPAKRIGLARVASVSGVHSSKKFAAADDAMSSEATRRAPIMQLRELVDRYLSAAAQFGAPVALSAFALSNKETERLFSSYEEDYHISRFFHFSQDAGTPFSINGFPATHVAIDAEIQSIL
jgi:hypothetical protein